MSGTIILTKDRPDLLAQCLESYWSSGSNGTKLPPVYVWDNGTDEETPKVCVEYKAKRLHGTGENVSFSKANNEAAKEFRGDLLLLNNDVFMQKGCYEALVSSLNEGASIAGAKLIYPNGYVQHFGIGFSRDYMPFHIGRGEPPNSYWCSEPRVVPAVTFACVLIKRKLWDYLGGLDEAYFYSYEDVDFCLRAKTSGAVIAVDNGALAVHLESQTEGRHQASGPAWEVFFHKWHKTGNIGPALGVWPLWVTDTRFRINIGLPIEVAGEGSRHNV